MKRRAHWSIGYENDGGPLIVLPRELLGYWHGSAPPEDYPYWDEDEDPPVKDDYARACDAAYPAAFIKVGPGVGLVFGAGGEAPVQWLRLPEEEGIYLVGWEYGPRDAKRRLVDHLRASKSSWRRFRRRARLTHGNLVVLHAACSGDEVREYDPFGEGRGEGLVCGCDAIPIGIGKGHYTVESAVIGGGDRDPLSCVLCRWRPVDGAV